MEGCGLAGRRRYEDRRHQQGPWDRNRKGCVPFLWRESVVHEIMPAALFECGKTDKGARNRHRQKDPLRWTLFGLCEGVVLIAG